MSPMGMGVHEGPAAIRGFFEDWVAAYDEFEMEAEEILDLGNEITFIVFRQDARLAGSHARVQFRYASVSEWAEGFIVRATNYTDIDEARAAAARLAEERA
jgi:ketosteroid isomerase-like protein